MLRIKGFYESDLEIAPIWRQCPRRAAPILRSQLQQVRVLPRTAACLRSADKAVSLTKWVTHVDVGLFPNPEGSRAATRVAGGHRGRRFADRRVPVLCGRRTVSGRH